MWTVGDTGNYKFSFSAINFERIQTLLYFKWIIILPLARYKNCSILILSLLVTFLLLLLFFFFNVFNYVFMIIAKQIVIKCNNYNYSNNDILGSSFSL